MDRFRALLWVSIVTGSVLVFGGPTSAAQKGEGRPAHKQFRNEVKHDRHKIRQDRREIRGDRKELRQDRRELRHDLKEGVPGN